MNGKIEFKKATNLDSELLFEWRNDPITIQNSITQRGVEKNEHERWFYNAQQNGDIKIYIAFIGDAPIGMVRFDKKEFNSAELSWNISPKFRGKGFGKKVVILATDLFKGRLEAKVLIANVASFKIAVDAGFKEKNRDDLIIYFEKDSS